MLKLICYALIFIGVCLVSFQYGTEKTVQVSTTSNSDDEKSFSTLDPKNYIIDRQFDRLFIDSSTWNNYDISSVNKIYKYKDLDNISDQLSI